MEPNNQNIKSWSAYFTAENIELLLTEQITIHSDRYQAAIEAKIPMMVLQHMMGRLDGLIDFRDMVNQNININKDI